jgi:chaperonin cofactor prefoldin
MSINNLENKIDRLEMKIDNLDGLKYDNLESKIDKLKIMIEDIILVVNDIEDKLINYID